MKKIIASLAAGGVLVAGAFTASMLTESPAEAQTAVTAQVAEDEARPEPGEGIDEVLSPLVEDGTITQVQADAVKEALLAKHEENREEREARREERREKRELVKESRELIRGFLEDGVISADELAQLPDGHPMTDPEGPFGDAIADGEITQDELDALREDFKERRGHGPKGDEASGNDA